jgi:hypothetical protein
LNAVDANKLDDSSVDKLCVSEWQSEYPYDTVPWNRGINVQEDETRCGYFGFGRETVAREAGHAGADGTRIARRRD